MGAHSFEDLLRHVGHNISCVIYGAKDPDYKRTTGTPHRFLSVHNVAVECEDCCEVLIDFDRTPDIDDEELEFEADMGAYFVEADLKKLEYWMNIIRGEMEQKGGPDK